MVNIEEATQSNDQIFVKRMRDVVSSQISCDVTLLGKELAKKESGQFEIEKISCQLIKVQKEKLLLHFDLIKKLHDRYIQIRNEGDSEDSEAIF